MEWFFSRSFRVLAEVLVMDPEIIYLWTLNIRIPNGAQEAGSGWITRTLAVLNLTRLSRDTIFLI